MTRTEFEAMLARPRFATVAGVRCEYLRRLPNTIPAEQVLVHNHIRPTRQLGMRGFRAWLSPANPTRLEPCGCSWAPELGRHYRVIRAYLQKESA